MNLVDLRKQMDRSLQVFQESIIGIRLGTVSANLVDAVKVECYGQKMPIKHLALTSNENGLVLVKPHDLSLLGTLQKQLKDAGFNAYIFSKTCVAISVPPISGDEKQKVRDRLKRLAEDTKVAIRNLRKSYRNKLDKDALKQQDRQVQQITDEAVDEADALLLDKLKSV